MAGIYTETIDVYAPTQAVSSDLAVAPGAVVFVATIKGNLHRGTEHSRATVNNLGVYNVTTGYFFTRINNAVNVGDRYILAAPIYNEQGALIKTQYWVVHGVPAFRNRFPQTAHLRAAITLLNIKPVGIP